MYEIPALSVVGLDSTDSCRRHDNDFRLCLGEKCPDGTLIEQVELPPHSHYRCRVTGRVQRAHQRRPDQPAVPGDVTPRRRYRAHLSSACRAESDACTVKGIPECTAVRSACTTIPTRSVKLTVGTHPSLVQAFVESPMSSSTSVGRK